MRGSHGHCRKRAHDYPPRPPVEQRKILSWHDDEDDALLELQRLEEKWKRAISSPGLGTLLNPLNVNLRQLQRTDRPSGDSYHNSVPVTAYNLKGEVIGEYHSMGDAARDLDLTREGNRTDHNVLSHSTNNRRTSFSTVMFSLRDAVMPTGYSL